MATWRVVRTADELKEVLALPASLWVCHASPHGHQEAALEAVDSFVAAQPTGTGTFERVRWDYSGARDVAKALGVTEEPSIIAVSQGELLDRLSGAAACADCGTTFLPGFQRYLTAKGTGAQAAAAGASGAQGDNAATPAGAASATRATATPIDIAKMVSMGKDLMAKRQPLYAEKFFAKALGVLDALEDEADDNISGSIAVCLGWLIMARIVQGRVADCAEPRQRLREGQKFFAEQPLSEPARAVALYDMCAAAPFTWTEADCSEKVLAAGLKDDPKAQKLREKLAVTLFLTGDVERCLTEALKLHVMCGDGSFGTTVLRCAAGFLGADHELVQRLGVQL